ncbi:MAG: hypothetical protein ACP5GJ_04130 [Nanopusillaceae archaeon]
MGSHLSVYLGKKREGLVKKLLEEDYTPTDIFNAGVDYILYAHELKEMVEVIKNLLASITQKYEEVYAELHKLKDEVQDFRTTMDYLDKKATNLNVLLNMIKGEVSNLTNTSSNIDTNRPEQ